MIIFQIDVTIQIITIWNSVLSLKTCSHDLEKSWTACCTNLSIPHIPVTVFSVIPKHF